MRLTKETKGKISDAWQYNNVGTCRSAMNELDKFADALLNSDSVEIEDENIVLTNLSDFIIWKNKKWDFGQIPILTNKEINSLISILNKLITDSKAQKIKFIETDPNNKTFGLNIISDIGKFSVDLGNVKNFENLPCYTFKFDNLKFNYIADSNFALHYTSSEFKKDDLTVFFNKLELK